MFYVGIDPGEFGSIAILGTDDKLQVHDLPRGGPVQDNLDRTLNLLAQVCCSGVGRAVLEGPSDGLPLKWTDTAKISYGQRCGELRALLTGLSVPFTELYPHQWTRMLQVPKDKQGRIDLCMRKWPGVSFYGPRGGMRGGGAADAALLALCARDLGPKRTDNEQPLPAFFLPKTYTAKQLCDMGFHVSSAVHEGKEDDNATPRLP